MYTQTLDLKIKCQPCLALSRHACDVYTQSGDISHRELCILALLSLVLYVVQRGP